MLSFGKRFMLMMVKKSILCSVFCSLLISIAFAQGTNPEDDGWYDDASAQKDSESEFEDLYPVDKMAQKSENKMEFDRFTERQKFVPKKITWGGHFDGGISSLMSKKDDVPDRWRDSPDDWSYTIYNANAGVLIAFPLTEAIVFTSGLGLSYMTLRNDHYGSRFDGTYVWENIWGEGVEEVRTVDETDHSIVRVIALSVPIEIRYIVQPREFFWAGVGFQPSVVVKQEEEYFLREGSRSDDTIYTRYGSNVFMDLGTRVSYISLIFDFGIKASVDVNMFQINKQYSARRMSIGAFVDFWIN